MVYVYGTLDATTAESLAVQPRDGHTVTCSVPAGTDPRGIRGRHEREDALPQARRPVPARVPQVGERRHRDRALAAEGAHTAGAGRPQPGPRHLSLRSRHGSSGERPRPARGLLPVAHGGRGLAFARGGLCALGRRCRRTAAGPARGEGCAAARSGARAAAAPHVSRVRAARRHMAARARRRPAGARRRRSLAPRAGGGGATAGARSGAGGGGGDAGQSRSAAPRPADALVVPGAGDAGAH